MNQRHVIKRQTMEITIDKNIDAWSLQQQISRMMTAQLIPLIDRYCGEISSPDKIHRIGQLELDLGQLDAYNLESDFTNKFAEAFHRGLGEEINRLESDARFQHSSSAIASHLELCSLFVQRGLLPWWADFQQPQLPENSLDYLLREAPEALRLHLTEWVRDSHALQRLVHYFDDAHLLALLELALPTLADFPVLLCQTLLADNDNIAQLSGVPSSRWREQLWQAMLQTAVLVNPTNRLSLFREITTRWTAALGLSHADLLVSLLAKDSATNKYLEQPKQEINLDTDWQTLFAVVNEYLAEKAIDQSGSASRYAELENWLKTYNADLLTILKQHLSESLQQSLLNRLKATKDAKKIFIELEAWISEHDVALPSVLVLHLAVFEQLFDLAKNATPKLTLQVNHKNQRETNNTDELYINNSGLVILYPFLSLFFEKLGLVHEGSFLNDTAMQTGVALLQYLANEDTNPPEHLLALNKLLCGMELEVVFYLETPLTEAEMDECNTFLEAVIEQAPILNKMSIAGFRGSFLLRQGILSSRDGASLLQVERETYDVVLDRFPWGMDWVKLPWMLTSLRVEW
ncbi:MAG: contractile injection system tape measure protein [Methylococcales bacterium]